MQSSLPNNLNYSDIKPIGYPSHVRMEKYTPIAFNTSTQGVSSSDVIRFNISTNGFWDPYSAYIKLEVDVSQMDGVKDIANGQASGCLQIDNSASSFINQLIIYKSGTEIERIEEYDTIAAILNDCNSGIDNRISRSFEGMNGCYTERNHFMNNYMNNNSNQGIPIYYAPQQTYYTTTNSNPSAQAAQTIYTGGNGIFGRYEFMLTNMTSQNTCQQSPTNSLSTVGLNQIIQNVPSNVSLNSFYGYRHGFCPSLCAGSFETILSKNLFQATQYNGQLNNYIFADRQTFCIPLISGLLGVLMPKDSYKYIPMKALQELILEFRLNPHAMFTSGYADGTINNATVSNGTGAAFIALNTTTHPMLSRIWRITKFEINVEVQYFESQIENIILSQLNTERGIIIHTQSWMLGPRYQIASNQVPNGTYQVNLGFESLKNVIWCYIPDEYQTFSFCRKQYRLSANISSMYIKVGSEYYPPLPITGNASNATGYQSVVNDVDQSNVEFLISLYKTFGKFNDIQNDCIINNVNFAVNQRPYNPTNILPWCNGNSYVNQDTALSAPLYHENRCVGRAVYAMNLETLNQDYSVISGINTINNRPFEITLKANPTNAYPRPYTMFVFCNYDMLVQLRSTGVQVLGRG